LQLSSKEEGGERRKIEEKESFLRWPHLDVYNIKFISDAKKCQHTFSEK
jgi:hypothetical protein